MTESENLKEKIRVLLSEKKYIEAYQIAEKLIQEGKAESEILIIWANLSYKLWKLDLKKINIFIESIDKCPTNLEKSQLAEVISNYFCVLKDFQNGFYWKHRIMTYLVEDLKNKKVPASETNTQVQFNSEKAYQLAWKVASSFYENKIPASFMFGTLLGIVREGKTLMHDKDIDFIVWQEYFIPACQILSNNGYIRSFRINYDNFASFTDPETTVTIDLMGLRREPENGRIIGGFLSYDKPPEWQLIRIFPWFRLIEKKFESITIFFPDNPEAVLESLYTEKWNTPDPEWIPLIHSRSIQKSALHKLYVYIHIIKHWFRGNLSLTYRLINDALKLYPEDTTLMEAYYYFTKLIKKTTVT